MMPIAHNCRIFRPSPLRISRPGRPVQANSRHLKPVDRLHQKVCLKSIDLVRPSRIKDRRLACGSVPTSVLDPASGKSRLAIFVSGGGSNFKCIHKACMDGQIHGEVVVVVSDRPTCGGVEYALEHKIPTLTFPIPKRSAVDGLSSPELIAELGVLHVDFVLLAGYLKLIPPEVVHAFPRRILNIHPALLPAFGGAGYYGMKVHEAVVASGARYSGPTIHFVDEEFDHGPILAQQPVAISPMDTPEIVAKKVLREEHKLYPECVAALCSDRIAWRKDGVPIMWTPS